MIQNVSKMYLRFCTLQLNDLSESSFQITDRYQILYTKATLNKTGNMLQINNPPATEIDLML